MMEVNPSLLGMGLLYKQLQLLAEKSLNADADTLVSLTDAMCKVYKALNGDL